MKFNVALFATALLALSNGASAAPTPAEALAARDLHWAVGYFFDSLGGFGVERGVNNVGGSCTSPAAPAGVRIPCNCPPTRADFIDTVVRNVQAGHVISGNGAGAPTPFPDDRLQRLFTFRNTLQGMMCPIVATSWAKLLPH
ncbi:hypothetical protein MKEN_00143700 [Mycena kentingensis (nom. inval.)]|nr:hypothetical protein MKEN_00143700 [Mycena kentingensis (nom. inval.)]